MTLGGEVVGSGVGVKVGKFCSSCQRNHSRGALISGASAGFSG